LTDEVYGELPLDGGLFSGETHYAPYLASKALSELSDMAWNQTYRLPVVPSNCLNNYDPYYFPEKPIPLVILNALESLELPVCGKGDSVRASLLVDNHARR
jgi:dTDP-glucose 4,6-dehydratase